MTHGKPATKEWHLAWQKERRDRLRPLYVERLGGVCVDCGTTESLEFDHIDPTTKVTEIRHMWAGATQVRLEAELEKCQLLCRSCHGQKSANYRYELKEM